MADVILFFILMIPLYAVLIWTYFYPEESMLFGQRWMYKEDPEFSDDAIRYTKFGAIVGISLITMVFALSIIDHFVIRLLIILGFVSFVIIGGYRVLKKYLES
ncbi:hypothetical protein [Bacillus sp. REN16]|uniref:hypothetical protein n=1 Tax=Bacillus sp. REN16 TaxID=2887296 RepID=UPI001E47D37B|nr:hypothetical protein [Bacillus sp. REN16]MCC3356031.1 hypothetical protein [Bacillus sp. REN16]